MLKECSFLSPRYTGSSFLCFCLRTEVRAGLGAGLTTSDPLGQGLPNPPAFGRVGLDQQLHQPQVNDRKQPPWCLCFLKAVLNISPAERVVIHAGPVFQGSPPTSALHLCCSKHLLHCPSPGDHCPQPHWALNSIGIDWAHTGKIQEK